MASGASLLVIIGPPYRSSDVQLITDKLTSDLLKWDTSLSGVNLDNELEFLRDLFDAPLNKDVRSTSLHHSTESFQTTVLINPVLSKVRQQLVQFFTSSKYAYRHLVYAGCSLHGSGCWLLRDGVFSYGNFASLISSTKPDGGSSANHVVLSIFEEGPWSVTSLSKLLTDSHVVIHDSNKSRDDVASTRQSQFVAEFVGKVSVCLSYDDEDALMPQAEQNGALTYAQPTLYVFPAGDGSALFFGINDFNFAFDSGSGRCAEFWNFLSHIQRLDVFAVSNFGQQNLFATSSLLSHVRNHKNSMSYPQIGQILTSLPVGSLAKCPTENVSDSNLSIHLPVEAVQLCKTMVDMDVPLLQCPGPVSSSSSNSSSSSPTVVSLYHKIGVGNADLYVISPTQDSREVKELAKQCGTSPLNLNNASQLLNAVSMCAALVWKPSSAHDRLVRVLYPGSTPVSKVFEGLERLRGNVLFERYSGVAETTLLKASSLSAKPQPMKVSMASKPTRAAVQTKPASQKLPAAKPVAEKAKPKEAVVAAAGKTSHQPAAAAAAGVTKSTSSTSRTTNAKSLSKTVANKPPAAKSPAAAKLNSSDIVSGPTRSEVIASASPFAAKELSASSPASDRRRVKTDHNKSCSEDEPPLLVNIAAPVGDAADDVVISSRDPASGAPAEVQNAGRVNQTSPNRQDELVTDMPVKLEIEERENSVSNGFTGAAGEQIDVALANNEVETDVEIGLVGNDDENHSPMHVLEEIGSAVQQNEAAEGGKTPTTPDSKFELDAHTTDDVVAAVSVESETETVEKEAFSPKRTSVGSVGGTAVDILEPVNNQQQINSDDQHQFIDDDSTKLIDGGAQLARGEVAGDEGDRDFLAQTPSDIITDTEQVTDAQASVKPEVEFNHDNDATAMYGSIEDDDAQIKSVAADVVEAAVTTPKLEEEHNVDFDDFKSEQTRNSIPSSPAEDDHRKPEDRCWSEHDEVAHEQMLEIDSQTDVNNETHIFGRKDDETSGKQLRADLTDVAAADGSIESADPDRGFQPSVDSIQTEPVDERIVVETSTLTHTEPLLDQDVATSSYGQLVETNDGTDSSHVDKMASDGSYLTKQFEEPAVETYAKQDDGAAAETEVCFDNSDDVISHMVRTDADGSSSSDTMVDALSADTVQHHSLPASLELEPEAAVVSDVSRSQEPTIADYLQQQPVNDMLSATEEHDDDASVKLTQDVIAEDVDKVVDDDTGADSASVQAEQVAESALQLDEDSAPATVNFENYDDDSVERRALENVDSMASEVTADDATETANHGLLAQRTGYEIADEMSAFENRFDHHDVDGSSSNVVPTGEVDGHREMEGGVPVDDVYPERRLDDTDYREHENTDWKTAWMRSEKCNDEVATSGAAHQQPQQDLVTSCENSEDVEQSLSDKLDDERHLVADDAGLDDAVTQHKQDDIVCSPPVRDSSDDVIDSNTAGQPMPEGALNRNSEDFEVPAPDVNDDASSQLSCFRNGDDVVTDNFETKGREDGHRDSEASEGNEFAGSTLAAVDVVGVETDQQDLHYQIIGESIEETKDLHNQAQGEVSQECDELQHQHVFGESIDEPATYSRPDTHDVEISDAVQDDVDDALMFRQADDTRYQTRDVEADNDDNLTRTRLPRDDVMTSLPRDDENVGCTNELERWIDGRDIGSTEEDTVEARERHHMAAADVSGEHCEPAVDRNDGNLVCLADAGDVAGQDSCAAVDSGATELTREEVRGDFGDVEEHADEQRHEDQHQDVSGGHYQSGGTGDMQETQLMKEPVDGSDDTAAGEIHNDILATSATTESTSNGAAVTSSEQVNDAASNYDYVVDGVELAYSGTMQPADEAQTELAPPRVEVAPSDNDSSKNHAELLTTDSFVADLEASAAANAPSWDGTRQHFFLDDNSVHPPEQNGSAGSDGAELPGRSAVDHPFQTFVGGTCDFDPSVEWDEPMGLPAPTPAANTSQHVTSASKSRKAEETGKSVGSKSSAAAAAAAAATAAKSSSSPSHSISKTASPGAKKPIKTVPTADGEKVVARRTGSEPRQATSASGGRSLPSPLYFDVVYIPTDMADVGIEFFRSVRARHYVISSTQPPKQLLDAVVEGKKLWLADNHDVAMNALTTYVIPTYRSPVIDQWYGGEIQTQLRELNIVLQPAASEHQLQIGSQYCTSYKLAL